MDADNQRLRFVYRDSDEPDPRFTLANERTLLAWIRTSLALVVTGFTAAAARLVVTHADTELRWVAVILCPLGAALAVYACVRWAFTERAMRRRRPLPATGLVLVVVAAPVLLLGLLGLTLL